MTNSINDAESVAEGDYEHFVKSTTGHVVILVMLIITVLYIRLIWLQISTTIYTFVAWLCCCSYYDDEDEEEIRPSAQMDSSVSSQSPLSASSVSHHHDFELGGNRSHQHDPSYHNYREEGRNLPHYDEPVEFLPQEQYYRNDYDAEDQQHAQYCPDDQYYAQEYYHEEAQTVSRSAAPQEIDMIPVSSRRGGGHPRYS